MMAKKICNFELQGVSVTSLAAKILLSVSLVGALLAALVLERLWASPRQKSDANFPPPSVSIKPHLKPRAVVADLDNMLPQFPFRIQPRANHIMFSGLNCAIETWQTTLAPAEVIDFYRSEMASLGWLDATEDTYRLSPEARSPGLADEGLEDPQYLARYDSIRQSRLVLSRGSWTLQISAVPESETSSRTTVAILGSPTASVAGFVKAITATLSPDQSGPGSGKGMAFEERFDGKTYRTTMQVSRQEPAAAFQATLSKLRAEGWRPAFAPGQRKDEKQLFAFLFSGRRCAYVSAMSPRDGQGACVMLTDVSP
jgi:hypothetical protein